MFRGLMSMHHDGHDLTCCTHGIGTTRDALLPTRLVIGGYRRGPLLPPVGRVGYSFGWKTLRVQKSREAPAALIGTAGNLCLRNEEIRCGPHFLLQAAS